MYNIKKVKNHYSPHANVIVTLIFNLYSANPMIILELCPFEKSNFYLWDNYYLQSRRDLFGFIYEMYLIESGDEKFILNIFSFLTN